LPPRNGELWSALDKLLRVSWDAFREAPVGVARYNRITELWDDNEESWSEALRAFEHDSVMREHLNRSLVLPVAGCVMDAESLLRDLIEHVIRQANIREAYDVSTVLDSYLQFEEFFYREAWELHFVTPIIGLELSADELPACEGVTLRRLGPEEARLFSSLFLPPDAGFLKVQCFGHHFDEGAVAIEIVEHVAKKGRKLDDLHLVSQAWEQRKRLEINAILSALRLIRPGRIVAGFGMTTSPHWVPCIRRRAHPHYPDNIPTTWTSLKIERSDLNPLQELWRFTREVWSESRSPLRVALDRFSRALEEIDPEEAVLDLAICAEALFLQGSQGELSYRFALRAAALLGETSATRRQAFEIFARLYKVRSEIAHGNARSDKPFALAGKEATLRDLRVAVEAQIRSAIRIVAQGGKQLRQGLKSNEWWDERILAWSGDTLEP